MNPAAFSPQARPDRAVISVTGEGALAFLHNLLTMELEALAPGAAAYGALLTPQGKILHDLFVVHGANTIYIDCAEPQADALLQKLAIYRLRARLDIRREPGLAVAVSATPGLPGLAFADPRLPAIGFRTIVAAGSLAFGDGYDDARLALGLADSVADIGSGAFFVHEANLDQLHGVSFSKGCYVGQEVVSRTHHRKAARARILQVCFEGDILPSGEAVESGGQRIGEMLSSAKGRGLALLRLDKLAEATAPLLTSTVRLHVQKPIWAQFEMTIPEQAA